MSICEYATENKLVHSSNIPILSTGICYIRTLVRTSEFFKRSVPVPITWALSLIGETFIGESHYV